MGDLVPRPPSHLAPVPLSSEPTGANRVLELSALAPQVPHLELGSAAVPTIGSIGHFAGNCKPCAFFYKQVCGNGVQCSFCHLCLPGEKKRRAKEKKAMMKMKHTLESAGRQ